MNSRDAVLSGYWPLDKSQAIVDKTQTIRLAPALSHLRAGEREAVGKLLEVGQIFQSLYEQQRHAQALSSYRGLVQLDRRMGSPAATQNLLTLYRLSQGPIATTLENSREPFLPVESTHPGKNVYPWGVTRQQLDAFLSAHPEKRDQILDPRTVVRRVTKENLWADLSRLRQYPVLDTLHPKLRHELAGMLGPKSRVKSSMSKDLHHRATKDTEFAQEASTSGKPTLDIGHWTLDENSFYAVPYAIAYADQLIHAHALLNEAADAVQKDDDEFARYLRNRSRDLLANDYESGDAAWITGHFRNLNAQIGAYESYDDELYGVKTFFAFSLLLMQQQETMALRQAMKGLQALEDSLPYQHHKKVREDIPVGVYDVIADFGQARGGNTATILPNESYLARRYGRTILLRANIMREPNIFASTLGTWEAAVAPVYKNDLSSAGNFYRTLWHEVGHYLGVDRTKDGHELDDALQEDASALEEMKADLVSLFVARALQKQGYYTADQLHAVYASGILRVLQNNKPRRDQPYQTMQLMQWNFFLEGELLGFDPQTKKLSIDYDKYQEVVERMLARVLEIQYQGDKAAADRFIEQYTRWGENLHGAVAQNIREQQKYRFRLFKYGAMNE